MTYGTKFVLLGIVSARMFVLSGAKVYPIGRIWFILLGTISASRFVLTGGNNGVVCPIGSLILGGGLS